MKKINTFNKVNKKIGVVLGTVALLIGLVAIPALAETNPGQTDWFGQMQTFMNSGPMLEIHNSTAMQDAMITGDVNTMYNVMNSNPELWEQMNEFMGNSGMYGASGIQGMYGANGMQGMYGTNGMGGMYGTNGTYGQGGMMGFGNTGSMSF